MPIKCLTLIRGHLMKRIFYLLLLGVLWGCSNDDTPVPSGPARPAMNKQDSLAIVAYYHSMKCAEWKEPYHWDIKDYTTWGGIEGALDVEKNEYRVIRVIVPIPQLLPDGYSLPPELGNLTMLRVLRVFGDERASGGIPKEIFNCPLEELQIVGKGFTGTIPKEIGKVKETLQWLKIAGTSIGGEIPEEITALQKVEGMVMLDDNNFEGKVPLFLRELPCPTLLSYNYFTEMDWRYFTEDIGHIPFLEFNCLSGEIPDEVLATERWKDYYLHINVQKKGYGYDYFGQ